MKVAFYTLGCKVNQYETEAISEQFKKKGYEILYLTDDVDEFALKMLGKYADKEFKNVLDEALDITSEDEKATVKEKNEKNEELLKLLAEAIPEVNEVRFTASLADHAACLTSEGDLSAEMEKTLRRMPGAQGELPKASIILEINHSHPIAEKLAALMESDKDMLKKYARILYGSACLVSGIALEDPSELSTLITELMV